MQHGLVFQEAEDFLKCVRSEGLKQACFIKVKFEFVANACLISIHSSPSCIAFYLRMLATIQTDT